MSAFQKTAQQAVWLVAVVVIIVAAILIFPSLSRGLQGPPTAISQSTQADLIPTAAGYPGPEVSAQLTAQAVPTQTPEGYPGPEATGQSPATEIVDYEATQAAMWAELTVTAQGPTATPVVLVGPRIVVDATGQYSLDMPSGWWATALAGTSLKNYDSDKLTDVHQLPPGGIKIYLGIGSLDGLSVNELLENKKVRELAGYNEGAPGSGDSLKFTDVQPLQLGPYPAFEYYMTTPEQFVIRYIAFSQDERIITIAISPADSRAMDEALMILSTLKFLPR